MNDWTADINAVLDAVCARRFAVIYGRNIGRQLPGASPYAFAPSGIQKAIASADEGDITLLRRAFAAVAGQDVTRFLQVPPRRGRPRVRDAVWYAARDVRTVRAHYKGQQPRPASDVIIKVVAARHAVVSTKQIVARLKKPL